ncbi:MAG: hypothetical protein GY950_21515 [bacterium]|nr:hypothetical protein [bacterium]
MKKSGWLILPAAFFLFVNFSVSSVKILFAGRLVYFLFLISLFFFLRKFNIYKILNTIVGGISFIVFSYGIIQKFVLFPLYLENLEPQDNFYSQALSARIESGRIFSIFRLPTLYAIICALLILFILHYLLTAKSLEIKIVWAFLAALGFFNLVLTQSFGGLIYLSVGVLAYLLLSGILKFKYLGPILMLFCLFFSLTIAFRYSEARKMEPVKLRLSNWKQAARLINADPFRGVGLGNYEATVSYVTLGHEAKSIYAHNFFLQFTAETGVIIPFFLLLVLISARKKLKPVVDEKVVYLSAFFVLLSYSLIDIGFYFLPAGLAGAVVLSQLYPAQGKRTAYLSYAGTALLAVTATLLILAAVSDNYRMEADLLQYQRQNGEVEANYKKSLAVNPYNLKSLSGYASLLFIRNKDPEQAQKYLDRVFALYPDSASAHFLQSNLEYVNGRLGKAYFHAARAFRKSPINSEYGKWYRALKNSLEKYLEQKE